MKSEITIPNIFWKYYDLYRRGKMTIQEFSGCSGLSEVEIRAYLKVLNSEKA